MLAAARAGGPCAREDAGCRGPQLARVRGAKARRDRDAQAGPRSRYRCDRAGPGSLAKDGELEKNVEAGTLQCGETPHGRLVRGRYAPVVVFRGQDPEAESPIETAASADHDHRLVPANARDTQGARGVQERPDRPAYVPGSYAHGNPRRRGAPGSLW